MMHTDNFVLSEYGRDKMKFDRLYNEIQDDLKSGKIYFGKMKKYMKLCTKLCNHNYKTYSTLDMI